MKYIESLNDKQKEAVLYTDGPLLIVAGAGAGKTKTITHRIIHLIHQGTEPSKILAVTFTNKAAKEMRDRVLHMLSNEKGHGVDIHNGRILENIPFVSTFHSLCVYIIKENANLLGLTKHFKIADEQDSISVIKEIMKDKDIDPKQYEPKKIKSIISRSKGDFITSSSFSENVSSGLSSIVALIWREYERVLKSEHMLDFDDLLLEAVILLKKNPELREYYQNKWEYIHIDEYQDTNEVQYELTKLLVGKKENICVVGDTDQNIYSWRGANIKNMLHFEKDYPNTKVILLEENYRSTKNIIEAANAVIKKNNFRVPKILFTNNKTGESIHIYEAYDETTEADYVAKTIIDILNTANPSDIAVLYRANFQSRILEESLLRSGIPYQVLGIRFFERKEIKDIIAYIRASYNQQNLSDIKRIINIPARGIGKVTLVKLFSGQKENLPVKMQEKIKQFYFLLDKIKEYAKENKPSEVIKFILKESGLLDELSKGSSDDLEKLENIKELVTLATKYDNMGELGIEKLIEEASLSSDQDTLIDKRDGVKLMTVHAAKGLEFKYVFITGLEEDLFPHTKTGERKDDAEEERRLFYVAVTRAREKLYLSYASLRTIFGNRQINSPSEFIYDIPEYLTSFEKGDSDSGDAIVYI